ncbi:MAG: ZIP family metal transporter [Bacilli bacterium]|nr:ZIP family metal transporter [Bacilli bacterium]
MSPVVNAVIGISLIFLCTTLGSSLVFFLKAKSITPKLNRIFMGFAAGIMLSASVFSLITPALDTQVTYMPSYAIVAISVLAGAAFLWGIDKLTPHLHAATNEEEGPKTSKISRTSKMFMAVTIHNVPEGLSVGIAYGVALAAVAAEASNAAALLTGALMLAVGIGIQNIPEGAVVALPVVGETGNKTKAFLFGTFSGAVEPIAAVVGLFLAMFIQPIMPWALAFAAGCMLYVVAEDMIPEFQSGSVSHEGVWSFMVGFVLMLVLDTALS